MPRKGRRDMLFTILVGTIFQLIKLGESLAIFETKILQFSNPSNRTAAGVCCQPSSLVTSACPLPCNIYFLVCLDDLHLEEPSCTFGTTKSGPFRKGNLKNNDPILERTLNISTSLSWPGVFGIRLQAKDNSSTIPKATGLIQSSAFVDKMVPGFGWKIRNETGPVSSILYRYRVLCGINYYGQNCTTYCKPRDDEHGHYDCNENGIKYCLKGWTNIAGYCKTPICSQTCQHGTCSGPDICSCATGWSGSDCSVCQTRPGCVNGTCRVPGGCDCNDGWGGNNCDKETDYCGMRKPCKNGGICINRGMGDYRCFCLGSFVGKNCETASTPCTSNPCKNGGICQVVGSSYKCNCTNKYSGTSCEKIIDSCSSFRCQNNGSCFLKSTTPTCHCDHRFTGQMCESIIRTPFVFLSSSTASSELQWSSKLLTSSYYEPATSYGPGYPLTKYQIGSLIQTVKESYFSTAIHPQSTSSSWIILTSVSGTNRIIETTKSFTSPACSLCSTTDSMNSQLMPTPSTSLLFRSVASSNFFIKDSISHKSETKFTSLTATSSHMFVNQASFTSQNSTRVFILQPSASLQITPKFLSRSLDTHHDVTSTFIGKQAPISHTSHTVAASISVSRAVTGNAGNVEYRGSPRRSLAIGISVSISFVIVIIIATIFIWTKMSKKRGHHTFRRSSTVIPASLNNPCRLIDAGLTNRAKERKSSAMNNNFDCYHINQLESSSGNSERSQVVSSKDICIEHNTLHTPASCEHTKKFYNEACTNFGYLSEGTSGYSSENSSGRSSTSCTCRSLNSALSTNGIFIIKSPSLLEENGDLPNCIAYQEEQL